MSLLKVKHILDTTPATLNITTSLPRLKFKEFYLGNQDQHDIDKTHVQNIWK